MGEVREEVGVGVRRERMWVELVREIVELVLSERGLKERGGIDRWRKVGLEE